MEIYDSIYGGYDMNRKHITRHILGVVLLSSLVSSFGHKLPGSTDAAETGKSPPQSTQRVEKYIYKQTPQGELAMYVHFPEDWTANDKRPAIVFFFGGGWRVGSVKEFTPQAEYLARRGMVTACADYRVKSRHGTMPDKCVEDGKSAVRWLRANSAKLGIDPNRIAASGHSAGGHIAACTCTTKGLEAEGENLLVSSEPNLLVLFNSGFEMSPVDIRQIGSSTMAAKISAIYNLSQDVPPAILFYGMKDRRHVLDGLDFIKKSEELGTIAELYVAEGQSHNFSKKSPWLERTFYLMDKFLERYGYTQGEPTVKLSEGKVEMKMVSPISLQAKETWGYTRLHRAARHGPKELVEHLISNGADVDAKDKWGCTPLLDACHTGGKELIKLLIAKGANVNARDEDGLTPLYVALWSRDKDIIRALVTNGADVNYTLRDDYPPLHYAVWNKDRDIVELFVTHGAKVNFTPEGGYPPLHHAVWNEDVESVKVLVNHGAKFNAKDQDGWTAYRYVVSSGNRELLEFFIAKGADASKFHMSAWLGDLTSVKRLVKQGTNVNTKDDQFNWTALHWVAFTGPLDVVEFLLTKGAHVNAKDEFNGTPLQYAAVNGDRELVELLLAKGANVNTIDKWGSTPLHAAARQGHQEVVALLIAKAADVNAKNKEGETVISLAKKKGHSEIVELLRKHGAKE